MFGLDPDFWKPDEEQEIVKTFVEDCNSSCACGHKVESWKYLKEKQKIIFNCSNEYCVFGFYSGENRFYIGNFMFELSDLDEENDGDIPCFLP